MQLTLALGRIIAAFIFLTDRIQAGFFTAQGTAAMFYNNAQDCGVGAYSLQLTSCGATLVDQVQIILAARCDFVARMLASVSLQ
jgi:hypothetical protein